MNNEDKLVSVVLPCFNEKDNILPLINEIHLALSDFEHEIIVVDDNSPDGTYDKVLNSGLGYVRAYKHNGPASLGLSIQEGILKSDGDYIVIMDSDFNHRPSDLPILVANLKYYDCVTASRFVYGGDMGNRFRHISSWLFNLFTRLVTKTFITDSLFGYFAIKRTTLFAVPFERVFWGYGDYCIRLMYFLQKQQTPILQIPGILGQRRSGQGNDKLLRTLMQYSYEVVKFAFFKTK